MPLSFHFMTVKEGAAELRIHGDRSAKGSVEPWAQFDGGDRQDCLCRRYIVVVHGGRR